MANLKARTIVRTVSSLTLLAALGASIAKAGVIVLPSATISLRVAAWSDPCSGNCVPAIYNGPFQAASQFVGESYPADSGGAYPAGNATAAANSGLPEVTAQTLGNSEASAILLYDFYIIGLPNSAVPITISGSFTGTQCEQTCPGNVALTNLGTSDSLITFSPFTLSGFNPFRGGGRATVPFNVNADATSDVIYQVELTAYTFSDNEGRRIFGGNPNLGPASYFNIDSTISISSTFQNANEFQLIFSPDIGGPLNTSVPEPRSLFLFAAGLLVCGIVQVAATRQSKI